MAARANANLFLQVGGDITNLSQAMKAGRSVVLDFADATTSTIAQVEEELRKMGAGTPSAAKEMERNFTASFRAIQASANAVQLAPDGKGALDIIGAEGARQAAEAATNKAAALRLVADAAERAAASETDATSASRSYATAAASVAVMAEKEAAALRTQAGVLGTVSTELVALRGAEIMAAEGADHVSGAHARMGASGMILQHVIRSTSDSMSAGLPIQMIMGEQIGRLSEATALWAAETGQTEGVLGKVAGVMGGPWGIAIGAGIALLVPFVAKLFEGNDALGQAVEKLKDEARQTEISDAAHQAFNRTLEGQIALQRELNKELDKSIVSERQQQQIKLLASRQNFTAFTGQRAKLSGQIDAIGNQVKRDKASIKRGNPDADVEYRQQQAPGRIAELRRQIAELDTAIENAARGVREAEIPLIKDDVATAFDKRAAAVSKYNRELAKLDIQKAIGGGKTKVIQEMTTDGTFRAITEKGISRETYTAQLAAITAERKAAEAAAEAAKKSAGENRQFGREVNVAQATAIVESIGGRVTSGYRSHAKQEQLYADKVAGRHNGPVAIPGTSAHESGTAIDVHYGPGISVASIKKAFAEAGVHLRQILREDGQQVFHVEFGKKGPSEETLNKRAKSEKTRAAENDRSFESALAAEDQRIARAKGGLADTIEQRWKVETDEIAAAIGSRNRELDDQVAAGKLTAARAKILKAKTIEVGFADIAVADKKLTDGQADRTFDLERDQNTEALSILQLQQDLALTTKDRLNLAHQILDKEQDQARLTLQHQIDREDDPKRKDALQGQLDKLPTVYAEKGRAVDRQNADPVEQYRNRLISSVGDMNGALKGVKADGLQGLEDGLIGIINGTESVGSAFKKMASSIISDLARIAVEKLILTVVGGFNTGIVPGYATGKVPGFANGLVSGVIHGAGDGTSDSILAFMGGRPIMVSNGESIMTEAATRRYGPTLKAMNDNTLPRFATGNVPTMSLAWPRLPDASSLSRSAPREIVYVQVDKSDLFDVHVQRAAAPLAQAAIVGGSSLAQSELAERQAQAIP